MTCPLEKKVLFQTQIITTIGIKKEAGNLQQLSQIP